MTTISIKDVPDAWASALRERAARNHRSLQGELTAILEAAVLADTGDKSSSNAAASTPAALRAGASSMRGGKSIEQVAMEHRQRFAQPVRKGPLAVDIIRQDRDAR